MIDKLDLRIPRKAAFSPAFARLYPELQALSKGPFHPAKHYEYAGDLREYGHQVRLNLYCRMDTAGNHKIAVDVPEVPLQWFRETVRIEHKRYRAAMTGERYFNEMGTGSIQTFYFGKRPNLIRIYDKRAEQEQQYRKLIRSASRAGSEGAEPPPFDTIFGSNRDSINRLRILDHSPLPEPDSNTTFETYCTGMYLRQMAENDGMQALNGFLSKHSKGNAAWARRKFARFLPSASLTCGLSESELHRRFKASVERQLSAQTVG